jgi:hypothetical protein
MRGGHWRLMVTSDEVIGVNDYAPADLVKASRPFHQTGRFAGQNR